MTPMTEKHRLETSSLCQPCAFGHIFFKYNISPYLPFCFSFLFLSSLQFNRRELGRARHQPPLSHRLLMVEKMTSLAPKGRVWRGLMVSLAVTGSSVDRLGRKPRWASRASRRTSMTGSLCSREEQPPRLWVECWHQLLGK